MRNKPSVQLAIGVLLLSWASYVPSSAATSPAPRRPAGGPYESAAGCGTCHDVMLKAWTGSPHARSVTSPAYAESLKRAIESAPDAKSAREGCVWCHAPTAIVTGDYELRNGITREGVTCDFCHTVQDVDMDKRPPFELKPGPVKRGPFEYLKMRAHETARSPLHRSSPLLCASCHEFKNDKGVLVLSNYSEWKESPYPMRGVPCQDCHMAPVPGAIARGVVEPKGASRIVNQHRLVGGSAISQLARGLDLKIESVAASGGSADVVVVVWNAAAGHSVPGGLSTKSLVLAVGAETADGKLEYRQERVYRRELKDDKGIVLESVADLFLRAASIGSDTRIKPMESRRERFTVPIPTGARAIVARLEYRDASDPRNAAPVTSMITQVKESLTAR